MKRITGFMRRTAGAAAACSLAAAALAADPPDSRVNPVSGAIETTDSTWNGSNYNVRHVITPTGGGPPVADVVSSNTADDHAPRLAIHATSGNSWVVWWRDEATDGVFLRRRVHSTGTWGTEAVLSPTGVAARNPEIVAEGDGVRVVWEEGDAGGTRSIAVSGILDDPEPTPGRTIVGSTSFEADLDSRLHRESSTTWVTWVDSSTQVGWSKWTGSAWTSAGYESYAGDSIEAARGRVREEVLNP